MITKKPESLFIITIIMLLLISSSTFVYAIDPSSIPDNTLKLGDDLYDMTSNAMLDPDATLPLQSLYKPGLNHNKAYFKLVGKWYEVFALTEEQFLNPTFAMTNEEVSAKIIGFNKWYQTGDTVVDLIVDKTALNGAIATADTKQQELYTAESWAPFATVLANAKTIAAKADATQIEVNNALSDLNSAMNALVQKPDDPILGQLADRMQEIYGYLGELVIDEETHTVSLGDQDKQSIRNARAAIAAVTTEQWHTVLGIGTENDLLTAEVINRFETEEAAKQAIINFVTGFSEVYYSTDRDELIGIMRNFRDTYTPTFKALFGDDVTMSDLYDLIYKAKLELPVIASANKTELKGLLQAPDSTLIDSMYRYGEDAMRAALVEHNLSGKLSAIGWSMDKVLNRQQALSQIIDPSRNIELALGKAYIRSQTDLITKVYNLTVAQEQEYAISVFGIGESEGLASLLDWYSTDSTVVDAAPAYLTAAGAGTATIIVYRAGDMLVPNDTIPQNDWIHYFEVTVTE